MALTLRDYVEKFRREQPMLADLTDEEIIQDLAQEYAAEGTRSQHPAIAEVVRTQKVEGASVLGELGRGFLSGVDQMQGQLYDTAALGGRIIGSEGLQDWGAEGRQRNEAEAAVNAPVLQKFEEVRTPREFALWLSGATGSNAPQMLGSIAAGAAAAATAPASVPALIAGGIGAGAFGFTQMQNYGDLEAQGGKDTVPLAIANGLIGAALEAAGPASIVKRVVGAGVKEKVAKSLVESIFKLGPAPVINAALVAAKEGSTEMLTELAQEATTMVSEIVSNRDNPDFKLDDQTVQSRLLNSGVAGFLLGGAAGAGSAYLENQAGPGGSNVQDQQLKRPPQSIGFDVPIPEIRPPEQPSMAVPSLGLDQPVSVPTITPPTPADSVKAGLVAQLIELGVPASQAYALPTAEAEALLARLTAAPAPVVAPTPVAPPSPSIPVSMPPDADAVLAEQDQFDQVQRNLEQETQRQQQSSQLAQLRSQRAAVRDVDWSAAQIRPRGVVAALQQTTAPNATLPVDASPGPGIFNLVKQAQESAQTLPQNQMMNPVPVAKVPSPPPVPQVSAPVQSVPAPVQRVPAPVPQVPAPVPKVPAPTPAPVADVRIKYYDIDYNTGEMFEDEKPAAQVKADSERAVNRYEALLQCLKS